MLPELFRDEHFVAVVKPAGTAVHRVRGTRERAALQEVRDQVGAWVHPIHRLDRGTHGVVLFGRTAEATRAASAVFERGEVEKEYLAVVRGHPPLAGRIDAPLVDEESGRSREAVTDYERRATTELPFAVGRYATARYASLRLWPRTGRTHQLRRHLAHLRHPIVGDVRHGDGRHNRAFREHFGLHRMLLFAVRLAFHHPFTGQRIDLCAELDPQADGVLRAIGLLAD